MRARWARKQDGVIVTSRLPKFTDRTDDHLSVQREDNGHLYWVTWGGLDRNYRRLEDTK